MIKLENIQVVGWEPSIRGMRNPKNSWDRMDSYSTYIEDPETLQTAEFEFFVGENDHKLMMTLAKGGPVHAKYRRMLLVFVDITAPLYWWKEYDTYKVGTVANSCSTMHKIHSKPFEVSDFSVEDLGIDIPAEWNDGEECYLNLWEERFKDVVSLLENARIKYNNETNPELKKKFWRVMIQYLPSSYNQKRTVMLSYETLANIYEWRRNHKLTEWHTFCDWIKSLPYSEIITQPIVEKSKKIDIVEIIKVINELKSQDKGYGYNHAMDDVLDFLNNKEK